MDKHLLNPAVAGHSKTRFVGVVPGREKFAFLYAVIAVGAVATAITYAWLAGLAWWQSVLMLIACLILGCGVLFSFLEVHRLAQTGREAEESRIEENPYFSRTLVVQPPTGDPYPHHEDYPESAGFDQGQLTSQLHESTPFIDRLLSRKRDKKQNA